MDGNGCGMGTGGTWVLGVLVLVGLVLLVLLWLNSLGASRSRKDAPAPSRSAARGILDERLARGELSPTEYRDRLGSLHEPL